MTETIRDIAVQGLCNYPVKGLRGAHLQEVRVVFGQGFENDRVFALLRSAKIHGQLPNNEGLQSYLEYSWVKKLNFVTQSVYPELAMLHLEFNCEKYRLKIAYDDCGYECDVRDSASRLRFSSFVTEFLRSKRIFEEDLVLVGMPSHKTRYPDRLDKHISIINLESLKDLSARLKFELLDSMRFRANILISNVSAWEEEAWVGKTLHFDGGVELKVEAPIGRCENVNVDARNGSSEIEVLSYLAKFRKGKFGLVACVQKDGMLSVNC